MYRALCLLGVKGNANGSATGAEIAEIAACLAAGESCPLVLACPAAGARIVSSQQANFGLVASPCAEANRVIGSQGQGLTSATLAAMDALLTRSLNSTANQDRPADSTSNEVASGKNARGRKMRKQQSAHPREDAAIVCAGLLDAGADAERDYRAAFQFAARHKLPILYVVANRLLPGQSSPLDLRSIYPEFGIPLFTVDANDAIAAYRVATEALHNARHLRGPSVIEALVMTPTAAAASTPLELLTAYMERHGNPPQPSVP